MNINTMMLQKIITIIQKRQINKINKYKSSKNIAKYAYNNNHRVFGKKCFMNIEVDKIELF